MEDLNKDIYCHSRPFVLMQEFGNKPMLEDRVLMSSVNEELAPALIPISIETQHPNTDWPAVWIILRTKGLDRITKLGLDEGHAGLCLHCRLRISRAVSLTAPRIC